MSHQHLCKILKTRYVRHHLQDVHDDAQGPNITGLVVLLGAEDLGGDVVGRVARRLQGVPRVRLLREAEVRQLEDPQVVCNGNVKNGECAIT